ncbi:MAG: ATP-binding cassette domain-containing protein [Chthonomonadaceae bacterium]|nr:ATP-binding cassette domain-containing protein [Chthonomonadaceae bacterium]
MALADTHSHASHTGHANPTPTQRLLRLLTEEKSDLIALFVYAVITGLLALVIPVTTQALVNTIAQKIFLQNLIVLAGLTLFGLLCAGIMRLLQLSLVETLQQRVFVRTAMELAERLPRIRNAALSGEYAPELVNRFFDVLTIQKTMAKLLLEGLSAFLQALVGLTLLGFYSPFLLSFDLAILVFIAAVFFLLGWGGVRTSIDESVQKYAVAEWLEEIARCGTSLKMDGSPQFASQKADSRVVEYLLARRSHYRIQFRQETGNALFQALAATGTLAIGGWLVINGKLSLGQLVASELIIVTVLSALDKLVKQATEFYDLLTGLEKVGHVLELPVERLGGLALPSTMSGVEVICRQVRFSYLPGIEILSGLDLKLKAGDRVSLVGASGAGKSTLASLLCGLEVPSHGTVEVGGIDVRDIDLESLRAKAALVSDINEIVSGTIEENIVYGRIDVTQEAVRFVLDLTQLTDDLAMMPQGLKTELVSAGRNLSRGQIQRLLLARAIADRPQLLILDEAFTGIDERTKIKILDALYRPENTWTIIDISHDAEVVQRSGQVYLLENGGIIETGSVDALCKNPQSAFSRLFPELCRRR